MSGIWPNSNWLCGFTIEFSNSTDGILGISNTRVAIRRKRLMSQDINCGNAGNLPAGVQKLIQFVHLAATSIQAPLEKPTPFMNLQMEPTSPPRRAG